MRLFSKSAVKTTTMIAIGVTQLVLGGSIGLSCLIASFVLGIVSGTGSSVASALFLGALPGLLLGERGLRRLLLASRFRRLLALPVNPRPLDLVARDMRRTPVQLLADLPALWARGCLQEMETAETALTLNLHGREPLVLLPEGGFIFQEVTRRSTAPIYMAGAFWLAYAAAFPLYRWTDFAIVAAGSAILYVLLSGRMSARRCILHLKPKPKPLPEPVSTGDAQADELLRGARKEMEAVAALAFASAQESFREQVQELLRISAQVLEYLQKKPEKVRQVRQFLHYYMPSSAKLLQTYDELGRQRVKGENIQNSMKKIEGLLPGMVKTFADELDSLYRDRAVDISAEVAVMRNMIVQEGIPDIPRREE